MSFATKCFMALLVVLFAINTAQVGFSVDHYLVDGLGFACLVFLDIVDSGRPIPGAGPTRKALFVVLAFAAFALIWPFWAVAAFCPHRRTAKETP